VLDLGSIGALFHHARARFTNFSSVKQLSAVLELRR
jgi:hypothetical protein